MWEFLLQAFGNGTFLFREIGDPFTSPTPMFSGSFKSGKWTRSLNSIAMLMWLVVVRLNQIHFSRRVHPVLR
jgi:hypothetical protein